MSIFEALYADVTDVNVLKQKRRAQRSMIIRQEQYFISHSKIPPQEIKSAEIFSKLNKLTDLISEHEALQNRIDDITKPGDDDVEFVKDNELLLKHSQFLNSKRGAPVVVSDTMPTFFLVFLRLIPKLAVDRMKTSKQNTKTSLLQHILILIALTLRTLLMK